MQEKIINFPTDSKKYRDMAEKFNREEKFLEALGVLFTALKFNPEDYEILSDIADTYAHMELYEYSNKYWFKYLEIAPEDKRGDAYEELAINYFYLDNIWATSYYFRLKAHTDGSIPRNVLNEDLTEFLNESLDIRSLYHIAYPYDRADYSSSIKAGKRACSAGDFKSAIKILSAVPMECLGEEACGDLTVSYLMSDEEEKAIDTCKESIKVHGKNVTAYCNLSSIYFTKYDFEKSEYYYRKALSVRKKVKGEECQIVTCAIEQEDYPTVLDCMSSILKDKPYDPLMWYFYGVAQTNCGNLEAGAEAFKMAYRINPDDIFSFYYADYIDCLAEYGVDLRRALPLSFDKVYPKSVEKEYKKFLREIKTENASAVMKNPENREKIYWGVKYGDEKIAKKCITVIGVSGNKHGEKFLLDLLIDSGFDDGIKHIVLFTLLSCGKRGSFGVVVEHNYVKVKTRKLVFDDKPDRVIYLSAYALCVSKAVFMGVQDTEKIAFTVNKVYKKYADKIGLDKYRIEDISAFVFYSCSFRRYNDVKKISRVFSADEKRVKELIGLTEGE